MDASAKEMHLEKLEELVKDEDKIVTLSSFASTQNISVQDSLEILTKFLDDNRKVEPDSFGALYVLIGKLKNGTGNVILLVKDCDIDLKMKEFEEISGRMLYGIQKSKNIDINILTYVDWSNLTNSQHKSISLLGTVRSRNATKRKLQFKKLSSPPPPTVKGKSSFFQPKMEPKVIKNIAEESTNGNTDAETKTVSSKGIKNKKETGKSDKNSDKKGLSAFFSKTSSSNGSIKSSSSQENLTKNNEIIKKEEPENTKSNEMEKPVECEDTKNNDFKVSEDSAEKCDLGSDIEMGETEKTSEAPSKSSKSKKHVSKSTKRTRNDNGGKNTKKRRRIIQSNDSDSDDIFDDNNEEETPQESDDENNKPLPVAKPLEPLNRRRVAVDRSYVDEEGFMVTKKEYIYESPPENGNENESEKQEKNLEAKQPQKSIAKKNTGSSENNTTTPPKGGNTKKTKKNTMQNQPTLMNFFKKK